LARPTDLAPQPDPESLERPGRHDNREKRGTKPNGAEAVTMRGPTAMAEHRNTGRVREALDAFDGGDFDTMRSFLAEDIVWHVGGDHPLSGDYRGRDEVLEYCARARELTAGTLRGEPLGILTNERHAGVFNRVTGERNGRKLDTVLAQAVRFDDKGRWTEYWALAAEQDDVDTFWAEES
jgi:ketosteroid isomerase-like protein